MPFCNTTQCVHSHATLTPELFVSHRLHSYLNLSRSLAWLVSRERNNSLHVNVCFADLLSVPSFWDDHITHMKNVVVDLMNIEDPNMANEIAAMAVSYYGALENKTLVGKFVDVSTGN